MPSSFDAIVIGAGMSGMFQLIRLRELGMSYEEAIRDLLPAATQSGLSEREIVATVKSAYRRK